MKEEDYCVLQWYSKGWLCITVYTTVKEGDVDCDL